MTPSIVKRDGESEGEVGAHERTRVDDTDPNIFFTPGPSPYIAQSTDDSVSSWVVVKDPIAWKGSAVATNQANAQLNFTFPGDSLTLGLLYNASGANVKLTLENRTSYLFGVSEADATASAPNGDKRALQTKSFRLDGLSCANHTATLALNHDHDARGRPVISAPLYFDWFSYASAGNLTSCGLQASAPAPSGYLPAPTSTNPVAPDSTVSHDYSQEYAGIGVGVAIAGLIFVLVAVIFYRRRQRHRSSELDEADRESEPRSIQNIKNIKNINEAFPTPLDMSQRSDEPIFVAAEFRPRGLHAFVQNDSFSSAQSASQQSSMMESPSKIGTSPLRPASPAPNMAGFEDVGYNIGRTLPWQHDEHLPPPGLRRSRQKLHYAKATTPPPTPPLLNAPSHSAPALTGGHALERMRNDQFTIVKPYVPGQKDVPSVLNRPRPPRRPNTSSAVDRLRSEARKLEITRPLTPFSRSDPSTSSDASDKTYKPRLATAPASSSRHDRFRRNSDCSISTHWSKTSADESPDDETIRQHRRWSKNLVDNALNTVRPLRVGDTEDEMWVSRRSVFGEGGKRRCNSISGVPPRPPKSPYRPSTGEAAKRFGPRPLL